MGLETLDSPAIIELNAVHPFILGNHYFNSSCSVTIQLESMKAQ